MPGELPPRCRPLPCSRLVPFLRDERSGAARCVAPADVPADAPPVNHGESPCALACRTQAVRRHLPRRCPRPAPRRRHPCDCPSVPAPGGTALARPVGDGRPRSPLRAAAGRPDPLRSPSVRTGCIRPPPRAARVRAAASDSSVGRGHSTCSRSMPASADSGGAPVVDRQSESRTTTRSSVATGSSSRRAPRSAAARSVRPGSPAVCRSPGARPPGALAVVDCAEPERAGVPQVRRQLTFAP